MATIKTSKLFGVALDWAVATCEEKRPNIGGAFGGIVFADTGRNDVRCDYSPSINWAQGGPIIEREHIGLTFMDTFSGWHAESLSCEINQYGETPLIAAMRCHVASKLGDTVDIPDELVS